MPRFKEVNGTAQEFDIRDNLISLFMEQRRVARAQFPWDQVRKSLCAAGRTVTFFFFYIYFAGVMAVAPDRSDRGSGGRH